ncbi:hypothetical protein N0V85_007450 [Neurospora sp. IMI 360204]|nr:hypothetical protein N0V85_007450 [Neurospora sp. IMI 360204]
MPFTSTFDWVPRGLTFSPTTVDPDLHIHHGGPIEPDTIPSRYRIETRTPNPSYLTPSLWIESMMSIVTQPSKSLILLESNNGPEDPGFAAPEDVIRSAVKALELRREQVGRVIGKSGSLTDYFFSETVSDASVELAFRWTSMPGCYVIFFGRFTPRLAMGAEGTKRMVGVVSHRGFLPISFNKAGVDTRAEKTHAIESDDFMVALDKHSEELDENPMRVFTVLIQLCVYHLDEEIHELGVRIDGTPIEAFAQVSKELAPDICGLRKACNDLLVQVICGGYLHAANIWCQKLKGASALTYVDGLRKDVHGLRMLVELRLEKLNYVDGVCSRMVMGADSGRRNKLMEG